MSRTHDRNIAIAIIAVVAVGFAAVIAVGAFERFGDQDDPAEPPSPDVGPTAEVYETFQEACDALVDEGIRGKGAKAPAVEDKDEIFSEYADPDGGGPIAGIGLTVCDRGWVIVVGVTERTAKVPSVGSNGTPVIAYLQAPFVAD